MKWFSLFVFIFLVIRLNGQIGISNTIIHVKRSTENWKVYDSLFNKYDWRKQRIDQTYDSILGTGWLDKRLGIGDEVPDIPLLITQNKIKGTVTMRDLKGKLIILDFWNLACGPCIAGFPEMERLQRKYGESMQIILVNPFQSQEEIDSLFVKITKKRFPKLPSIANAFNFYSYFPAQAVPYHVWISPGQSVALMGSHFNTYEEKITSFLKGNPISFVENESSKPGFVPDLPYYRILNMDIDMNRVNTYFTKFNYNYATKSFGHVYNYVDSANMTRRNTFINLTVQDLCLKAWHRELQELNRGVVLGPFMKSSDVIYENVLDSAKYTDSYLHSSKKTDVNFVRARFCYEQIAPLKYGEDSLLKLMQQDIIDHFAYILNSDIKFVKLSHPAKVLFKRPFVNPTSFFSKRGQLHSVDSSFRDNKLVMKLRGMTFSDVLKYCLNEQSLLDLNKVYFIDTVFGMNNIDIDLPTELSFEDLNKALKKFGLTINDDVRQIGKIKIRDLGGN